MKWKRRTWRSLGNDKTIPLTSMWKEIIRMRTQNKLMRLKRMKNKRKGQINCVWKVEDKNIPITPFWKEITRQRRDKKRECIDRMKPYRKIYLKKYRNLREKKARHKAYMKIYNNLLEIKKRHTQYMRIYNHLPQRQRYLFRRKLMRLHPNFKRRQYQKKSILMNTEYAIARRIRHNVWFTLNRYGEGKQLRTNKYGIDIVAIAKKLGAPPNDGKQYHIDHIIPCSAFDFHDLEEIKKCYQPDNLRWLPAKDNIRKSAAWEKGGVSYWGKRKLVSQTNKQTNIILSISNTLLGGFNDQKDCSL